VELQTNGRTPRDIAFLFAGLVIGSGVALLLAPAEGEDVRYAIRRGYKRSMKKISRETEALRDQAENLIEHAFHIRDRGGDLLHIARPHKVVQGKRT
jgi:gas vesicle protein